MHGTEFFQFENEIWYKKPDGTTQQLKETNREVVKWMLDKIEDFYPKALVRLKEDNTMNQANITGYQFTMVDRFCRCNFAVIDDVPDISSTGRFRLEHVPCPLRGICKDRGVICDPKFNSNISDAEMRVLELLHRGERRKDIADTLCLSLDTVLNHLSSIRTRIGAHNDAGIIRYAYENKLFKEQ